MLAISGAAAYSFRLVEAVIANSRGWDGAVPEPSRRAVLILRENAPLKYAGQLSPHSGGDALFRGAGCKMLALYYIPLGLFC